MIRYGTPPTDDRGRRDAGGRASLGERGREAPKAADTVRKWHRRHPDRWQHAMQIAEMQQAVDMQSESVVVLRGSPATATTRK